MIVLDELHQGRKYYRKKINAVLGALDKGVLISKYLFSIGMNRHEIEAELYKKFKLVYLRVVNEGELRKKIKYMIDVAEENPVVSHVATFNQSELDLINSQEEENIMLLLMTMMCIYKYYGGEFKMSQMDIQRVFPVKMNSAQFHNLFERFLDMGFFNSYIKLEKKFEAKRYNGYFQPSDELLSYTRNGSYVVMIEDFRNLKIRIKQILGYEDNYYICSDCGCIDVRKKNTKTKCQDCSYESNKIAEENWKEKNNWKHPNLKDSNYDYYYPSNKK